MEPFEEVMEPFEEVMEPFEEVMEPVEEVMEPVEEVMDATEEVMDATEAILLENVTRWASTSRSQVPRKKSWRRSVHSRWLRTVHSEGGASRPPTGPETRGRIPSILCPHARKAMNRIRCIARMNPKSAVSVLARVYAINTGMGKAPAVYSAPVPPLTTLMAQAAKVSTAQQLAATRAPGAAAARDVQLAVLAGMVETECSYTQTLCDAAPDQAVAIAEGGGFVVAASSARYKALLKVVLATAPGTVHLDANATVLAGKKRGQTCFHWEWTPDGGKTVISAPSTPHAKTTIASLPPLTTVGFRVNMTNRKGTGEWSQWVTILIH